jgi:hypothetical protein
MAPYRIVFHDARGEPIAESAASHPDDAAAIDHASRHSHRHEIHIWQGDRLVARVPARPHAGSA